MKIRVDREHGTAEFPDGTWRGPSQHDYEVFVSDHAGEWWFIARVMTEYEHRLPRGWDVIDPGTGFTNFDHEAFVSKYGADTAAIMFDDGEIDWSDTAAIDGDDPTGKNYFPYLEVMLTPSRKVHA